MTTSNNSRRAGTKHIARTDIVSPSGSKVVVKRIRLTPAGRDALTTKSEGIKDNTTGITQLLNRRSKKALEPA